MSSSEELKFATLSDSSDDIGVLSEFARKLPTSSRKEPVPQPNSASEPDWVRDFNQERNDAEQRAALLALLGDDSDDDSVINLISQERTPAAENPEEEIKAQATKESSETQKPTTASKRARVVTKPKSNLPLVVAPKLDDSLVLLQSAEGDLDLSGDIGAVGRVKMQEGAMFLDIKGVIYRTSLTPCNTICVVTVGEEEARITSVLDEVVTLECERNLFASDEVVVHGALDEDEDEMDLSQLDGGTQQSESKTGKKKKKPADTNGKAKKAKTKSKPKGSKPSKSITKQPRRKT